jgi:hypothetical protein
MIHGQFYWRGVALPPFRQSRANLRRQQDYFADFFYWPRRFAPKLVKFQRVRDRGTRTGKLFAMLLLLFQKSTLNFAILTGNGNVFNKRCRVPIKKNNIQSHSPRPIPNDWHCFWPILVFAGHYLQVGRHLYKKIIFFIFGQYSKIQRRVSKQ